MNLEEGQTYRIEIPDIHLLLQVVCIYKSINAYDIKIIYAEKNNEPTTEYNNHMLSYRPEWGNSIYFRSFTYREKCIISKIILSQ